MIRDFKRPKALPYRVGDVFAVPLGDGSYGFGQVLWDPPDYRAPTCSLLEFRAQEPTAELEEILTSRTLAVIHSSAEHLQTGHWQVCGHEEPIGDPFTGPCGDPRRGAVLWDGLEGLARAWFGCSPWNDCPRSDFLDRFLMP